MSLLITPHRLLMFSIILMLHKQKSTLNICQYTNNMHHEIHLYETQSHGNAKSQHYQKRNERISAT